MPEYRCEKCKDTGKRINDLGIEVICECQLRKAVGADERKSRTIGDKPTYRSSGADCEMAVKLNLIPAYRKDDVFDVEKIKSNLIEMNKVRKFKIFRFDKYIEVLNKIASEISINEPLEHSYIIGAPNGFGKTSFANSCIKNMYSKGMSVVPYISLIELAGILDEYRSSVMQDYVGDKCRDTELDGDKQVVEKAPSNIVNSYGWKDYINADIVFTYFTIVANKVPESKVLKALVDIRSQKGLPTIVFISTSLDPYTGDNRLREYIWDELLAYNDDKASYDRLVHVSCYKRFSSIERI